MDPTPSSRVRVSRACDRCKRRKIRCTGMEPCLICIRAAATCMYASPYNRGRHRPKASRPQGSDVVTEHQQPSSHVYTTPGNHQYHGIDEANTSCRESPEPPIIKDREGHYVGPASAVSFLIRVQNRLRDCSSPSSPGSSNPELSSTAFTFGDVALAESDTNFCGVMVSREETSSMLCHYFDFTVPMDQFLHRPTVEIWLREFHETMGVMRSTPDAPARRAVLWMIFCMGAQKHTSTESTDAGERKSVQYFLAADYQLSKERGAVSLASVQARLCQCLWLLSQSRMNHCWDLFGRTARLAMALGFHRRSSGSDLSSGCSRVEIECRRRTFWSAYCLDNYLSITMGRPRIFHDDDIDQELPSSTDEGDLHPGRPSPQGGWSHSTMVAPVAYFKLSRIVSHILRDIYSIKPSSLSDRSARAEQYSASLKEWRAELPQFLDTENREAAPLIPIFYRQRIMLNLAYWHTMLLTNRLFLLSGFSAVSTDSISQRPRSRSRESNRGPREEEQISRVAQIEAKIEECLKAAMNIVDTFNELVQMGWILRSFWVSNQSFYSFVLSYILQPSGLVCHVLLLPCFSS
jgi:hypothetical protein